MPGDLSTALSILSTTFEDLSTTLPFYQPLLAIYHPLPLINANPAKKPGDSLAQVT
jgi:hypothetical protein